MPSKFPFVAVAVCTVLSGCVSTPFGEEQGPRRDVSPAALAALPAGMSPDLLLKGGDGCYMLVVEEAEPLRGVPLRNGLGLPVCDA